MRHTLRGFFGSVLVLSALAAVTSSNQAAARAGGLIEGAAGAVRWLVSPAVPAIPDRRTRAEDEPTVSPAVDDGQDWNTRPRKPRQPRAGRDFVQA